MGNPDTYFGFSLILGLVSFIIAIVFFVKHAKVQTLLARWSGGEYVERNSRFNMLVFHGFGALTLCALTAAITVECLANSAVGPTGEKLIFTGVLLASLCLYHFIAKRFFNPARLSDKTVALEVVYGLLAVITTAVVLALCVTWLMIPIVVVGAFMFWLRYPKVQTWVSRRAGGHYTVPDKRYGKIMLHGLGMPLVAAVGALAGFLVCIPFQYLFSLSHVGLYFCLISCGVAAGVYGYYTLVLRKRSQSGATPMQVQWEILWGTCMLWGWIFGAATLAGAIALAVMAIMILLAVVVVGIFVWLIWFFAFAEERTISTGGLFSRKKKEFVLKNFDGTYTDINGNTYKEK